MLGRAFLIFCLSAFASALVASDASAQFEVIERVEGRNYFSSNCSRFDKVTIGMKNDRLIESNCSLLLSWYDLVAANVSQAPFFEMWRDFWAKDVGTPESSLRQEFLSKGCERTEFKGLGLKDQISYTCKQQISLPGLKPPMNGTLYFLFDWIDRRLTKIGAHLDPAPMHSEMLATIQSQGVSFNGNGIRIINLILVGVFEEKRRKGESWHVIGSQISYGVSEDGK